MVVALHPAAPRTSLGRVHVHLARCGIDKVRHYRTLFGGVTLQGKSGLKVAERLKLAGDLVNVDLDPAIYLRKPRSDEQLSLDLEVSPFDWVQAQRDLELPVVRTAGRRIRAGRYDELRAVLDVAYRVPVSVVLVLDEGWLGQRHVDVLLSALRAADRDVSLVFAATYDPFKRKDRVGSLRRLLDWSRSSGCRLELLRTDLIGLPAVVDGACLASIGLSTSTRHFGLPLSSGDQDSYEDRQRSPLVFVPRLLHWQRGEVLGGLSPWRGAGVTECGCPACDSAGADLLRFAKTFTKTVPSNIIKAVREHDSYALSNVTQSILSAPDPRAELRYQRKVAQNLARSVAAQQKVRLDMPPWIASWD
jgi:hypothetical protein